MNRYPQRKRNRLADCGYDAPGAYFITICTAEKKRLLSEILAGEALTSPAVALTALGELVQVRLLALPDRFPNLRLDKYVLMPNHVHILLTLTQAEGSGGASPSPTVIDAVRAFKSITARLARPYLSGSPLWQRSFYDHVVRNEADYREIWNYIDGNPSKWAEDRFFPEPPFSS